ncbi:MAG: hypothetical protein IPI35_32185 [Deltaproteobacteria bacterium]|nr:hypothetical protein [Deltaproteobacteria bacterium]
MTWEAGNDGYQAPDWAIDLAADVAEVAVDAIVDVLSEGALVELDPEIAELTGKVVKAIGDACNWFSKEIVKLSDDGGRLNMIAVANHNLNKLLFSVQSPKSAPMLAYPVFSEQSFEQAFGHSFNDKDNEAMEYESHDSNYRTWRFDKSVCPGGAGLYASTKIDHIRGENKDDHIILMIGYNAGGRIIQGQVAIQMKNEPRSSPRCSCRTARSPSTWARPSPTPCSRGSSRTMALTAPTAVARTSRTSSRRPSTPWRSRSPCATPDARSA